MTEIAEGNELRYPNTMQTVETPNLRLTALVAVFIARRLPLSPSLITQRKTTGFAKRL